MGPKSSKEEEDITNTQIVNVIQQQHEEHKSVYEKHEFKINALMVLATLVILIIIYRALKRRWKKSVLNAAQACATV